MAEKSDVPSVTIDLDYPIEIDGGKIESLTMRLPKVKDNLWASKQPGTDLEKQMKMIARLCDVSFEVIEEIAEADMGKVDDAYGSFRVIPARTA